MGFFRKKSDPISERAKLLGEQIAAIEAEIQRLNDQPEKAPANGSPFSPIPSTTNSGAVTSPAGSSTQPRLRSTALPHQHGGNVGGPAAASQAQGSLFEEMDQAELTGASDSEAARPSPYSDLGMRKHDAASVWQRFKNHFRGPVTSNPKLVHYLSAGSIQGLRPLRYEKRVARNRVLVLAAFLVLALWGVIAIFISRH